MEYKKRTISSILDESSKKVDEVSQKPRRRTTSIDDDIEMYSNYLYSGSFNIGKYIFCGLLNLMAEMCCQCCRR